MLSGRRKVGVEDVPVSKNSGRLDYRFRAVGRDQGWKRRFRAQNFWLTSWEWLNLPRKNKWHKRDKRQKTILYRYPY